MKLSVGCGAQANKPFDSEWVKIDLISGNVRADARFLPFKDNSFEEIRAIHVLEHIPRCGHDSFYDEIYRVLKPDGLFYVEVPNLREVCRRLVNIPAVSEANKEQLRIWTLSLYGKNRHLGDSHHWGFMPYLLREDLEGHSFIGVEEQTEMVSNHYLMEPVILFRCTK